MNAPTNEHDATHERPDGPAHERPDDPAHERPNDPAREPASDPAREASGAPQAELEAVAPGAQDPGGGAVEPAPAQPALAPSLGSTGDRPSPAAPARDEASEPVIRARGLGAGRGARPALQDLDLELDGRQASAVLGPRGAGQSTLLEVLAGVEPRAAGTLEVLGQDPQRAGARLREQVAWIPDPPAFYPGTTALQLDRFLGGVHRRWERRRFFELLRRFDVPARVPIERLEPESRLWLALSAALAAGPTLLLLDLPAGVDPLARLRALEELEGVRAAGGGGPALLVATSDPAAARAAAERELLVLAAGRAVWRGPPGALERAVARLELKTDAERPALPATCRPLGGPPRRGPTAGALWVRSAGAEPLDLAALAALPGVIGAAPCGFDEAYRALVS